MANNLINPKIMVESGVAAGGSGKVMLECCSEAEYYGYDRWTGFDDHVYIQEAIAKWKSRKNFNFMHIKFGREYGVFWRKEQNGKEN